MGDRAGKARAELGLPGGTGEWTPSPLLLRSLFPNLLLERSRKDCQRQKQEQHCSAALSTAWEAVLSSCLFWCAVSSLLSDAPATGSMIPWAFPGLPSDMGHTMPHKWSEWWRLQVGQCLSWGVLGMFSGWT